MSSMYCYTSIGKSSSPLKCNAGYFEINGKIVRCPQWQKNGQSIPMSRILEAGKIIPVKYISNYLNDLRRDFGFLGSYSYGCLDWNEMAEDTVHYVVFNRLNEYYDLEAVITCYVNKTNPIEELTPHTGMPERAMI